MVPIKILFAFALISCKLSTMEDRIEKIDKLPSSMKGYELYCWKQEDEERYKLLSGTNVKKHPRDILIKEFKLDEPQLSISIDNIIDLKRLLAKLPDSTYLVIIDGNWWSKVESESGIKEHNEVDKIIELTKNMNIQIIN